MRDRLVPRPAPVPTPTPARPIPRPEARSGAWPGVGLALVAALLLAAPSGARAQVVAPPPAEAEAVPEVDETDVTRTDKVVVTALRHAADTFEVPYFSSILGADELRTGPEARSLPNALRREPGVLLQKTGPGQSSPYIRGFTGFRTLMLVDGIRLNNSVFRDGPNQYWGTVDNYAIDSLELIRGPAGASWGSDAIGGVVNALTGPVAPLDGLEGEFATRWASAERAFIGRLQAEFGQQDVFGARIGVTSKNFGNIEAGDGSGNLPDTAYEEEDWDARVDIPLHANADLTLVAQHVRQDDVPRTHKTIHSVPFHGTVAGTELQRDLDQERDLYYARLAWEGSRGGLFDRARVTVSRQRQEETQERLRTGDKRDRQGFEVHTWGLQAEFEKDTDIGLVTWGLENFHDDVDSFREDFVGGVSTGDQIQGPVADDASYDLFGAFIQDEILHGDNETVLGLRWTRAAADADKVDNPNVPGSDPTTPGNVLDIDEDWSELVGSARTTHFLDADTNVWAGLSQGFRAPNLSDLTSELTDSGIEEPTPDLDPEHFLALELGGRARRGDWTGEVVVWNTWIDDMIVRSPTGEVIDDVPVFSKSNVGDGNIWGIETRAEYRPDDEWTWFGVASYQDGEINQFDESGDEVDKPTDRLMPLTAVVGATLDPPQTPWWLQADVLAAAEADKLSLRDETDTERIPPGGTPGYAILGLRGTLDLGDGATLGVAVENLLDKDHRIHGSGVNEPGRNLVITYSKRFGNRRHQPVTRDA